MITMTWRAWLAVAVVLVAAAALAVVLLVGLLTTTYLVDLVPGADASDVTSPALEAARAQATWSGWALLLLGLATGATVIAASQRSRTESLRG